MEHYYLNVNTDRNGRHEIHTGKCTYLPSEANREYIGFCTDCNEAIKRAKLKHPYKDFDGCFWCSRSCHRG